MNYCKMVLMTSFSRKKNYSESSLWINVIFFLLYFVPHYTKMPMQYAAIFCSPEPKASALR